MLQKMISNNVVLSGLAAALVGNAGAFNVAKPSEAVTCQGSSDPLALLSCQHHTIEKHVTLEWSHPRCPDCSASDVVHELWLLDNRPDWRHSSGQKMHHVNVDAAPTLLAVECNSSGLTARYEVLGATEAEESVVFPVEFLVRWASDPELVSLTRRAVALEATSFPNLKSHDYFSVMNSDTSLLQFMQDIYEHGVGFVHDALTNTETLQKVLARMGGVMETLYGPQWSMKSKVTTGPKNNIAYSDLGLPLHSDLVYFESPPGIQFLHCIEFDPSIKGGESQLLDVFHVAETLRTVSPSAFQSLAEIPVTYQKMAMKREVPAQYEYRKPHISLHPESGEIMDVVWSPPFEGPLRIPLRRVEEYYRARKVFEDVMANVSQTHLLQYRMEPGMLVAFSNRRMLHGRSAFSEAGSGGQRHFEGAYVNIDHFLNKLQVMRKLVTGENPPPHELLHVGNRGL